MAVVFKIKHGDTLRRWVVSESVVNAEMFPITLEQLQAKIRELFQLSPSAVLAITYVDKDNDVVTLGEDRDLVDACLVQRLNPLRLEVQVLESKPGGTDRRNQPVGNFNIEGLLKLLFPHATAESLQSFLERHAKSFDSSLPTETLILKAQDAFKDFLAHAARPEFHKFGTSDKPAYHHPYKHPFGDMHCKSMPNRGEYTPGKDGSGFPALHLGVQCDECGVNPILGPRFKSNKIPDFDLCSTCFQEKGKEGDYGKIEYPVDCPPFHDRHYRPPYLKKGLKQFMGPPMCPRGSFARGPYGWRLERPFGYDEHKKLDARFMKDVTIFDGTELAPGTKFTKIWRMCNNGSLAWPQNTQLLHIGGDIMSVQEAVNLELPENGLTCGEEVEVSVDLTAPEKAGRYISHWRLKSPTGQKFGQRVWVTIQVVPHGEQSPMLQESLKEGDAKGNNVKNDRSIIEVPIVSMEEAEKEPTIHTEKKDEMMVEGVAGSSSRDGIDLKITELGPEDLSQELEGFSLVEKPDVEFGDEEMADNPNKEKDEQEMKLQSLESMGFVDRELNAVLLGKNSGNVQLTLDDLLVAAGWDGALGDLQEMGFTDQSTNVRLLMKHKGSVKAAVRDLVQMGKQKA
ncbi:hypothetical protein GOP47_0004474 [Adiantum capillus-veneris]|uniref:ZZ-type domain-containing protein n=1 Tax=Adiantum capillus-veneris TaxID=13818 RepID=A0A9D4V8R2_ADICA|nr:hypothetical protein GOP47_0003779 [Adiantum capillus-veneris]KAI5081291.1 hypothetical protein GOP47_0004474 [Adiantum capillus-veneris]